MFSLQCLKNENCIICDNFAFLSFDVLSVFTENGLVKLPDFAQKLTE